MPFAQPFQKHIFTFKGTLAILYLEMRGFAPQLQCKEDLIRHGHCQVLGRSDEIAGGVSGTWQTVQKEGSEVLGIKELETKTHRKEEQNGC
ncbi:Hypothetical predicted protein [Podarcis lilfordi]|uniref:Uncharacterized protein n=1 Tax=Podarcis lilfordi TaxID=74358 RepID=A0AA35NZU6_9SAUR|nr:Hypothetical predicted protein [Podarcis lilfordi]